MAVHRRERVWRHPLEVHVHAVSSRNGHDTGHEQKRTLPKNRHIWLHGSELHGTIMNHPTPLVLSYLRLRVNRRGPLASGIEVGDEVHGVSLPQLPILSSS